MSYFLRVLKIFLCNLTFLCCIQLYGQDTIKTLNAEQFLNIVKQYHPISQKAKINIKIAKAEVLNSRSAFDPILSHYTAQKTFNNTNYYNYSASEITIPTWYGIELNAGIENLTGERLDNNQTLGKTNYIGIDIPLLKNLVYDKRRAFLQQAKIFEEMAVVDQKIALNDLSINAMEAYWNWVKAYQVYLVVNDNVIVNQKRFNLIKRTFQNGERPAIDTLEALTQLQSFEYLQNEKWLQFLNEGLNLSAFLWTQNIQPYTLPTSIIPQQGWENETNISNFNLDLDSLINLAESNHPELIYYNLKLDALALEKRLKFQELLPKVDLRYNQLGKGYAITNSPSSAFFENNYQYGLKIEIPLRLSQGRGEYQKAKLKIQSNEIAQSEKLFNIQLKVKNYHNEFEMLKKQIVLQSSNFENYQQLTKAEVSRFNNGESSLFLINSRENKALDALGKLIELKTKYFKNIYALQWSAGLLQN